MLLWLLCIYVTVAVVHFLCHCDYHSLLCHCDWLISDVTMTVVHFLRHCDCCLFLMSLWLLFITMSLRLVLISYVTVTFVNFLCHRDCCLSSFSHYQTCLQCDSYRWLNVHQRHTGQWRQQRQDDVWRGVCVRLRPGRVLLWPAVWRRSVRVWRGPVMLWPLRPHWAGLTPPDLG